MSTTKSLRKCFCFLSLFGRAACAFFCAFNGVMICISLCFLYLICNFLCQGILRNRCCDVGCTDEYGNARSLSEKEKKRCCIRYYIIMSMVMANTVWILVLTAFSDQLDEEHTTRMLQTPIIISLCAGVVFDIILIKPKNFKYLCKGFMKKHDDHYMKAGGHVHGNFYQQQYYQGQPGMYGGQQQFGA